MIALTRAVSEFGAAVMSDGIPIGAAARLLVFVSLVNVEHSGSQQPLVETTGTFDLIGLQHECRGLLSSLKHLHTLADAWPATARIKIRTDKRFNILTQLNMNLEQTAVKKILFADA